MHLALGQTVRPVACYPRRLATACLLDDQSAYSMQVAGRDAADKRAAGSGARPHRDRPELEGKNLIGMQDTKGKFVIKDMIDIAKNKKEGFYEYSWTKPDETRRNFPKIAFAKYFEPFDWVIGTGEYLDDIEKSPGFIS